MVAAGLVAVPRLATHLERTDLTSLARTWAARTALDEARLSILSTITSAVPPDGFAAAHQATTAVLREEEDRLARLAAQLDHLRLWRSGPKHVRALMRAALLDERKTLAVATTQPLAQQTTLPAGALTDKADRADRALNAAMRKSHVRTANVPAANLRAAERYLAHERQLLDDAPPYRVVVTSNGNSYLLDLASSTVRTNTSPFSSYHQK